MCVLTGCRYTRESLEVDRPLGPGPSYHVALGHLEEHLRRALHRLNM